MPLTSIGVWDNRRRGSRGNGPTGIDRRHAESRIAKSAGVLSIHCRPATGLNPGMGEQPPMTDTRDSQKKSRPATDRDRI